MSIANTQFKSKNDTVRVSIRMRPLLQHEDAEFWTIDEQNNSIYTSNSIGNKGDLLSEANFLANHQNKDIKRALMDSIYSPQSFTFDRMYSIDSNSQTIYKEMCRDIIKSVLNGFNCSIFMYGQTTSGKTFTMLGSPNSPGILPCSLRDVFSLISKEPHPNNYSVYCSYVEIYNENIHDLLTDANYLKLIDDSKYGVVVAGAKRVRINNFEDGIGIKDFGEENRKYRETLFNEYSSRSHTIFQIFIESVEIINQTENNEGYAKSRFSCLNLVDLAGSERINEYDPKAEGSGETGYINRSLFVLANVINRLADTNKKNYIPYRDSKLTRLLSQALGGKSLTAIICTVSPAALNYYQTLSTLRFGTRAKIVKLKPAPNEYLDDKGKLELYKNEIKKLKNELNNKNKNNIGLPDSTDLLHSNSQSNIKQLTNSIPSDQRGMLEQIIKSNEALSNELQIYKDLYINERAKNDALRSEIEKMKEGAVFEVGSIENNEPLAIIKSDGVIQLNNDNYINNRLSSPSNLSHNYDTNQKVVLSNLQLTDENNKQKQTVKQRQQQPQLSSNATKFKEDLQRNINERQSDINYTSVKKINPIQKKEYDFYKNNITSPKSTTSLSNNTINKELNQDDIIEKINTKRIFEAIELNYSLKTLENFEDNIKTLKETYELKVDTLEKTMDYYKSYIETFFRKKIQETRNTNMDNVELIEDHLPIMQITSQHNDTLKALREQYEGKIKELETRFFATLRLITAQRMDNMSKE